MGTTRLAQSESFSVEIQGWHHEINKLITLDSPTLKLEKTQLLIAGVQLVEDEDGDRTVFHLVPKNAFDPTPVDVLLDDDKSTSYAGKHDNF